jgi:S1-C subfamily serine protease
VSGTVTGLHRSITAVDDSASSAERLTGLVQTNAAIQPGDSGGPIVNGAGKVVGMDTAASQGFSFQGVPATQGFAIPINRATSVAALIEAARASTTTMHIGATPFLGVGVVPVNTGFGASDVNGVLISGVVGASPAAKAGLGQNDVITKIDGRTVSSPAALTSILITKTPGTVVQVGWLDQNGGAHTSSLRLASGPPQ